MRRRLPAFASKGPALLCGLVLWLAITPAHAQDEVKPVIDIQGIDGDLEENVEAYLAGLGSQDLADAAALRTAVLQGTQEALQALGYYDAVIQVDVRMLPAPKPPRVFIRVQRGEPVRWREIDLRILGEGQQDPEFEKLVRRAPRAGQVLHHGRYEELKRELRVIAASRGYFDAQMTRSQLEIDRDAKIANLRLTFDTGTRYQLGAVNFSETRLGSERLAQLTPFEPGTEYAESHLTNLNKRLLDSGYFASVTIRPEPSQDASQPIDVSVQLRDNPTNRIETGVGYGTDSGARLRLDWRKPLVNPQGHSLQTSLTLSQSSQEVTAEYRIPAQDPINDYWMVQAGWLEENFEDTTIWTQTLGLSRQTLLSSGWWRNPFLRVRSEKSRVAGDSGSDHRVNNQIFLVPGLALSKTHTEGGIHPDRGYRLRLETEFSDDWLGSDTEYLRVAVEGSYLYQLAPRHQVLSRLELGTLVTSSFDQVPLSARFFAGGDRSVRGYDYNSISPEDDDGAKIGGRYLATASLEYLYRFKPQWQAALFVDQGGAFDRCCGPMVTGVGVGLRWLLPFGNVRIDVANGLDDGGWQLHLFMGGVL